MRYWKSVAILAAVFVLAYGAYALRSSGPEMVLAPAGTRIQIRLDHGISTESNAPGDIFEATLNVPLMVEGEILAPEGSKVQGQLTQVKESGRIEGRAALTMVLRDLQLGDSKYDLATAPLTLEAPGTKKKDAQIIGGSAAAGSAIGAIAGGGVGAAIGAGIGAGSGAGVVLATKGVPVAYGPEAVFTFTLSEPVQLPASASESL